METFFEVISAFFHVGKAIVLTPFFYPETAWYMAIPLCGIFGLINGLILSRILCPKFDKTFQRYLEDEQRVYLAIYPSLSAVRAIYYALTICIPRVGKFLAPKMVGYDFRSRIGTFTYVLCWLESIMVLYPFPAVLVFVIYVKVFGGLS